MRKGETINRLFVQYRQSLPYGNQMPFAVQKITWGWNYYVIVETLNQDTGIGYGVPTKDGHLCRLYIGDKNWGQKLEIPQSREPIWQWREDVDLSYYKNNGGWGKIYELGDRLKWGKHQGLTIEELCQEHLEYIEWAVANLGHNFCLSEQALTSLLESGLLLDAKMVSLNREKLIWYQHELSAEYRPEIYRRSY